jgi:hypothetical protein
LERIASGLNQPTYVTQAPGDAANILYITERTTNTIGGAGAANDMGKIWRYDVTTRAKTLVADFSDRNVTLDTGLHTLAFAPDFNVQGAAGYQKMYVSLSEDAPGTSAALNKVEEYTIGAGGAATFSRMILQYPNNRENNHTVDWVGFDPTATGAERNYLYISVGDGSFGNSYNDGTSTSGRPSQNPSDVQGKILRVDISGSDAYPSDPLKNFAIPATNPIPVYNAAHPGAPIMGTRRIGGNVVDAPALGEVWVTGVRNGYRTSFDRATGDMWIGDVGETVWEEIDFIKAGSNTSGPPVDLGWPLLEGTEDANISGAPPGNVNPFTGVTALNPIQQKTHQSGDQAWIGGYVYRGPVAELQGKYFFAEFVNRKVYQLQFDRTTPPSQFNGANGTRTEMTSLWNSLVGDPTDPEYGPSSDQFDVEGLDHIVSFGEDNAGNLYIVDFGNRSPGQGNFDGQYPNAGLGEIFRITPSPAMTLTVNRDTGAMTLSNDTGAPFGIDSYSITSASGALEAAAFTPITGNFDAPPGGNGAVDPNDDWQVTSPAGSRSQFREESLGDGGLLAADQEVTLSAGGAWLATPTEDVLLQVTASGGTSQFATVVYVGNDGLPFTRSDLDANGVIDLGDWHVFLEGSLTNLAGLTDAQQYRRGDLNGDNETDFDDFRIFEADFNAANGAGALAEALAGVPEPGTGAMAVAAVAAARIGRRRARRR